MYSQVSSAERFGIDLCQHFLDTYRQVSNVRVHIDEAPWTRIKDDGGREHNHAFIVTSQATRFADVFQERYSKLIKGPFIQH